MSTSTDLLLTKKELSALFNSLTPQELEELDRLLWSGSEPWLPQPGPQTLAANNEADELLYGGAAGGGKTDLLIGLAATQHERSIIFRREAKQTQGVEERIIEMLQNGIGGPFGRYIGGDKQVFVGERPREYKIYLGGVKAPGDEQKWNGRPHDLKAFDELVQFTQYQYTYLNIWKRSKNPKQRCRTVSATNPPVDEDQMWIVDYWAPWLSKHYTGKRPAIGELRYFIMAPNSAGNIVSMEVEPTARVTYKGKEYEPKSRSFIPSRVDDNMYYAGGAYESQLAMLPDELRDKYLGGDFMAGIVADPMQLIPRDWVERAFERWKQRTAPDPALAVMDQLGVDVTRGGIDRMICSPRYGNYFATQITIPSDLTRSGIVAAQKVSELMVHPATVAAVDVIGVGTSCYDHLCAIKANRVIAMDGAAQAHGQRDKSGLLGFVNARALWHWRLREALDPTSGEDLAIPPDDQLLQELCAARWKLTARGIQIEAKADIKQRIGRSPDKADSLVYAWSQPAIAAAGLLGLYAEETVALREKSKRDEANKPVVIRIGSK